MRVSYLNLDIMILQGKRLLQNMIPFSWPIVDYMQSINSFQFVYIVETAMWSNKS